MMKCIKPHVFLLLLVSAICFIPHSAHAVSDSDDDRQIYTAVTQEGQALFTRAGLICIDDEYISCDNTLYKIISVSGTTAVAKKVGEESMPDVSWLDLGDTQAVFAPVSAAASVSEKKQSGQKLIAMYVTHSDESYVPSDGTQSINGQGGIYDVAREFRDALQNNGIDVILDESTHLPHDSGAYRRSRRTAERLLQHRPDAIIDIHRDGIPDQSEYACTIDGKNASQIRLLVGRGNQNSDVNRTFAKQIKAVADKKYPDLIKDIFIGKGTYNQDLSPNAILLEFGTHTISKEKVLNSTEVMADVVSTALYGETTGSAKNTAAGSAKTSPIKREKDKSSFSGIALLLGVVVIGMILFALVQTGSAKSAGHKLGRNLSEMTGGLIGKKNNSDNK